MRKRTHACVGSLVGLLLSALALPAFGQETGCEAAVALKPARVTVAPVEGEDTANILCAMEAARDMAVPEVRLGEGRFDISSLTVRDFRGALRGQGITRSTIALIPESVDCSGLRADRISPAGIKFVGGAPTVQYLTLEAVNACQRIDPSSPNLSPFYFLHFTGPPRSENCERDLIFATVDRISLVADGTESAASMHGIGAFAEDDIRGGCKNTLLGRLRINRSSFTDVSIGAKLSLKGNAEVNITDNEFTNNIAAIVIFDSAQYTTIAGNQIVSDSSVFFDPIGISIFRSREDAPQRTQFAIHDNEIDLADFVGRPPDFPGRARGISFSRAAQARDTTVSITGNRIVTNGTSGEGVLVADIHNPLISNNLFVSDSLPAVVVRGDVADAAIIANDLSRNAGMPDIDLGQGTTRAFVGSGQGSPLVTDDGIDNIVVSD